MRVHERVWLKSEIWEVQRMLDETPEDSVINRLSLEGRLNELRERLKEAEKKPDFKAIAFAFQGDAVEYEIGIYPKFVSKVTLAVSKALTAILSSGKDALSQKPDDFAKEGKQIVFIDKVSHGGFLYFVDLIITDWENLNIFEEIIEQAFGDNEEKFSDLIKNIAPSVLAELYEFYNILIGYNTYFTFQTSEYNRRIVYPDIDAVKQAANRLKSAF